ncbi:MAG: dihydroorotate dehydrogenase electron transfer subunit, partial [Clostridia bacterium]|nr:dihydroorotate dehydrogenase electron transfer subunit [Clostridia bacterium]
MTQGIYEILQNEKLVENVYKATFKGDTFAITAPGQFVNILIEGLYLRRPISIYDYDDNTITIIYKVV